MKSPHSFGLRPIVTSLLSVFTIIVSACGAADSRTPSPAPAVASSKGLHFATGPADGAALALEGARSVPSDKTSGQNASDAAPSPQVSPPVAIYHANLHDIASSKGLKSATTSGDYFYLVSGVGPEPMGVSIKSNPTGKSKVGSVGIAGYTTYAIEIAHTKLAGLKEVAAGSYEVRLVISQPGLPVYLWLKSLTDDNDLVYAVLWVHADGMFKDKIEEKLYTAPDFLKIIRQW